MAYFAFLELLGLVALGLAFWDKADGAREDKNTLAIRDGAIAELNVKLGQKNATISAQRTLIARHATQIDKLTGKRGADGRFVRKG